MESRCLKTRKIYWHENQTLGKLISKISKIAHHEAAIWDLHSGAFQGTYRSVSLSETQQVPAWGFKTSSSL